MAHTTTHVPAATMPKGTVNRILSAIGETLVRIGESNAKMRQVQALVALSDEELAARGLRREDIARHVFSDSYWV